MTFHFWRQIHISNFQFHLNGSTKDPWNLHLNTVGLYTSEICVRGCSPLTQIFGTQLKINDGAFLGKWLMPKSCILLVYFTPWWLLVQKYTVHISGMYEKLCFSKQFWNFVKILEKIQIFWKMHCYKGSCILLWRHVEVIIIGQQISHSPHV